MAETESFKNLKEQYFTIDRNFNRTFGECENDTQKNQLRRAYTTSRDNFWEARRRIFIEDDPLVEQINDELKKTNEVIKEMLADLHDIVQTLDTISSGVKLGSTLITAGSSNGHNS